MKQKNQSSEHTLNFQWAFKRSEPYVHQFDDAKNKYIFLMETIVFHRYDIYTAILTLKTQYVYTDST